jgi:alkylation response protein AidB-like acyl-CoA dehydrogenase
MDLSLTPSERAFRDELREWLGENHPGAAPQEEDEAFEFERAWLRTLNEGGWAGVSWPQEYGGRGASLLEQAIFIEEMAIAGAPQPANFQGLHNAGPAIIHHGTAWQQSRYLPRILSGDDIWCQGFSEPEAGSDLAGLKTRAVKQQGGWRVTGQKIWTSGGHKADMCILLARTNPDAPKHRGITYFLMSMREDGIDLRRIRQSDGLSDFNEMFMDDVWIPDENVVGSVDEGWRVALTTLMHERAGVGTAFCVEMRRHLNDLISDCRRAGATESALTRDRLAQLHIEVESMRLNVKRSLSNQMRRGQAGPESSLAKLQFSEIGAALADLAADALGTESLSLGSRWGHLFIRSRAMSIEGGTTEIQKNIIAERVLGLPRGPR